MNLEILDLIGKRLLVGEKKYGNENVANDGRDFVKEALEESLDLAVYVAAKLIEIEKEKEKQMGRAITHENEIYAIKMEQKEIRKEIKEVRDMVQGLSQTTQVHHVDLADMENMKIEGVEVKPDTTDKRRKTRSKTKASATT